MEDSLSMKKEALLRRKEQLRKELDSISLDLKTVLEEEHKQLSDRIIEQLNPLLMIVKKHEGNCSDDNISGEGKCVRCTLMKAQVNDEWNSNYTLCFSIVPRDYGVGNDYVVPVISQKEVDALGIENKEYTPMPAERRRPGRPQRQTVQTENAPIVPIRGMAPVTKKLGRVVQMDENAVD